MAVTATGTKPSPSNPGGESTSTAIDDHVARVFSARIRGGLEAPIDNPYTHLERGTYLHNRPRRDVFRLLIDCYRLRVEDNINFHGSPPADTQSEFKHFLDLAAQRPGLLPPWWDADVTPAECIAFATEPAGCSSDEWYNLKERARNYDMNGQYGSPAVAVQLRILGGVIYQDEAGAAWDGKGICRQMARYEQKGAGH